MYLKNKGQGRAGIKKIRAGVLEIEGDRGCIKKSGKIF